MKDERKAITVRVSPELKFQIDKAANKDNRTINSWIINFEYVYLIFQSSIVQNFFKNNMTGIIGGVSIKKLKTFSTEILSTSSLFQISFIS